MTAKTTNALDQQIIGRLLSANMNSTSDQTITIRLPPDANGAMITGIYARNASISLTTAAGGIYTAAAKGGTAIVAAAQVYSALTGSANQFLPLTLAANWAMTASGLLYLSLTTAQGAAATADIHVVGVIF